jgi:hypothetical protein
MVRGSVDHLAVGDLGGVLVEQGARVQERPGGRRDDRPRAGGVGDVVADAAFSPGHNVRRDATGQVVDHGGEHALGIVVQAHGAIDRAERHVDVLLGGDDQGRALFGGVLRRQRRAVRDDIVVRQTDAQGGADLGAVLGELAVILAVDVHDERVRVAEQTNRLSRYHVDRQQRVGHYTCLSLGLLGLRSPIAWVFSVPEAE